MNPHIRYESRDGIALITLARPEKKNAINAQMARALCEAWARFEQGGDKVAVLSGEGGAFTAGADLKDPPSDNDWAPNLGRPVSKPIIAAIDGWCIGAGVLLALQADLAIATPAAKFSYPEAKLGLSFGLEGALAARIPFKPAMEMLLLGGIHDAEFALRTGFVNRIEPVQTLLDTALQWAAAIAALNPEITRFIKANVLATLPQAPGETAARQNWLIKRLPATQTP